MRDVKDAAEALRFFMERDGLRQSDLPEIGNQAKISGRGGNVSVSQLISMRKANEREISQLKAHDEQLERLGRLAD